MIFTHNVYGMSLSSDIGKQITIIEFSCIGDLYYIDDSIEFGLKNNSKKDIFIYCAVEKNIMGDWHEVIPSIELNKISKAVKLSRILPNQMQQFIWNIKQQNIYYTIDSGVYRFKFEIFEQKEIKSIGVVFSKEFRILQQP